MPIKGLQTDFPGMVLYEANCVAKHVADWRTGINSHFIGKGFTVEWVADYFSVATSTLYLNYTEAIKKGRVFRDGCLRAKQFHTAMVKNNVTVQIWLGKQWLKQTDKVAVED